MKKWLVLLTALTFSAPAFAYLDPGSGSAIVSAVIGAFVAMGMVVKTYWYKIKSFFVKKDTTEADKNEDTLESEENESINKK
jgi:hypothetical protein